MSLDLIIYLLLGALGLFVFLSVMVLAQTWVERKALARIQMRMGPMRVGFHGALQPLADAIKLAHLNGKGPAGIALAWAAQRQSLVKDGSIAIDTSEEGRVRIRMHECPYGLKQESEVPICKLSNAYDLSLAEQMGAVASYEMRMTTMHPYCELVIQTPALAAKIAAAELDGAKPAGSSDEPADANGAPEAAEKVAAESE